MSYAVRLDVFEGPLDLLLQLVSKERVDVADISISTITDDYLQAVKHMEKIDLDLASAFLVLAATLLELKSYKLLPKKVIDDPELAALLEERDHLVHRLIEYSTFKRAAESMKGMLAENEDFHTRTPQIPPELAPALPDIFAGLTVNMLAEAAVGVFAPRSQPVVDLSHVTPMKVSVREMIELLADQIQVLGSSHFSEIRRHAADRIGVIVRFLALLELFKRQSVDLEQPEPFGDIVIRWRQPMAEPWKRPENDERDTDMIDQPQDLTG